MAGPPPPLRIANCSGFFGDRHTAAAEMVTGGPIDVLTGDWLAELTMLILARQRSRSPDAGYARTFVDQMAEVLGTCVERGIRVVANAGGQNPAGCAAALEQLCASQGITATVAWVHGDDLLGDLDAIRASHPLLNADTNEPLDDTLDALGVEPVTANAYLGGWGIAAALGAGADVVVTGRITDAALVVGPAAWHFGWRRTDFDAIAGAVVAGHVIECGTQCTGGNYAFFTDVPGLDHPGFPIAEVHPDGSSVITKHPGTGGAVTAGTVTAQLLYEIQGPWYANADACVDLTSIRLTDEGDDRVRIDAVRGGPPPDTAKVAVNTDGGWRNAMTFVLTGPDIDAKAALAERTLWAQLPGGRHGVDAAQVDLLRFDTSDPATNTDAVALLRVAVADRDRQRVGRGFSNTVTGMLLGSYPGMFTTTPPTDASPVGVYWPVLVPWSVTRHLVEVGGASISIDPPPDTAPFPPATGAGDPAPGGSDPGRDAEWEGEPAVEVPLGAVAGARSGDKGGNANIGLWVTNDDAFRWLAWFATPERIRALIGSEADGLNVSCHPLANLRAVNVVVEGLLGRGVAATLRLDAQAKGLGEFLRARHVHVPARLVDAPQAGGLPQR